MITHVHERMAELWAYKSRRPLTAEEQLELEHCLDANTAFHRRLGHLYNLSYAASLIGDTEWQHEICGRIEKLCGESSQSQN